MTSFNTKLVLCALAIAAFATPALAQQRPHRHYNHQPQYQTSTYPNPQIHSGSEQSHESGNDTIGGQ